MAQSNGLTVRQHEREIIDLDLEFMISREHQDQVRYSSMSGAVSQHTVRGRVLDVSSGGMGMQLTQFVPRMCEGMIRVFNPNPVGTKSDGSPIHEVMFETRARVLRISMDDHAPTYSVGVAFCDPSPDIEQKIDMLHQCSRFSNVEKVGETGTPNA